MGRSLALAGALVAAAALVAPRALADGDPASDFLLTQNVFLPFSGALTNDDRTRFAAYVGDVAKAGYPIKVAVIAAPVDLGAVPSLFRQPQRYARFLGQELSLRPTQRLLVAMPNGYGFYRPRGSVGRERRALAAVPPAGTAEPRPLAAAAARAVRRLAALDGASVPAFAADGSDDGESQWRARLELAAIVLAALAVAGGVSYARRRRARPGA